MSTVKELIRVEENGAISFGNYELDVKSKLSDFECNGDVYKVKTFSEITKLERNGMFVYESVPGTTVLNLTLKENGMEFSVEVRRMPRLRWRWKRIRSMRCSWEKISSGKSRQIWEESFLLA